MGIFGRSKTRTNRRPRNTQGAGPLIRIQTESREAAEERYSAWIETRESTVSGLTWFGQHLTIPAQREKRYKGERLSEDDEHRVLLSWLAGGSVLRIARREAGARYITSYNA